MRRAIATGAAVLALAALGAAAIAGCGSGEAAEASSPATIRVTPAAQTGTTVDAKVGDTVILSFEANPTTGYEWAFTAGDTFTIEKSEYVPYRTPTRWPARAARRS